MTHNSMYSESSGEVSGLLAQGASLDLSMTHDSIYNEAKQRTLQYAQMQWQDSLYFRFLQSASRSELLKSQIPFYHAVQAFPRLLCKLAGMVETSEARYLVVENIWEEHGSGKGGQAFHTNTFKTHLKALGWEGTYLERCPFIDDWLEKLFNLESPQELFLSLAAIEYLYAVVSANITDTLDKHNLLCEQGHYNTHSALDWEHGRELLEAMLLAGHGFNKEIFDRAQSEFLNVFDSLAFPTVKDMEKFRESQPVAFYYTREDSGVLDEAFEMMQEVRSENMSKSSDKLSLLLTCSGGEHIFHCLAKHDEVSSITALDVNPEQIRVCQDKLKSIRENSDSKEATLDFQQQAALGRFEFLFSWIRQYLSRLGEKSASTTEQPSNWWHHVTESHLKYVVGRVFSNDVLEAVFTRDATMYTSASFADHFVQVLRSLLQELDHSPMARNIFLGEPFPSPEHVKSALKEEKLPVRYICSHIQDFDFKSGYDLIDLSNIGDWLPLDSFRKIVQRAVAALTPGGSLILRRLLGDYDIVSDIFNSLAPTEARSLCTLRQIRDRTHFYSQTVVVVKSVNAGVQARL